MRWRPHHPVHLILGLCVWSIWFVVLYGGLSVACQLTPPEPQQGPFNWLNALLWLSTLVVVGLLLWAARVLWRAAPRAEQPLGRHIGVTSAGLYLVSAFSTLHLRTFNGRKADQSGTTARSHGRSPGRAEHGFPGTPDGHHRPAFLRTHAAADRRHPGLAAERYSGAALDHGGRRIPAVAADAAAAQVHLVTRLDTAAQHQRGKAGDRRRLDAPPCTGGRLDPA